MPYELKLSLPNLPKGQTVAFTGLPKEYANGKTHIISDEEAEAFRVINMSADEEGSVQLGAPLDQAFKKVEGVIVSKAPAQAALEGGAN